MRKRWRWWCNHPWLLQAATEHKCNHSDHDVVQGVATTMSGIYPEPLCGSILDAVHALAVQYSVTRFTYVTETKHERRPSCAADAWNPPVSVMVTDCFFLDVERDEAKWKRLLLAAQAQLDSRRTPTITVENDNPLKPDFDALIPWKLERLQFYKLPKSRRFPSDFPFAHRGMALLLNDDTILIETESVESIAFPRGRLAKPAQVGIFWYGEAPEHQAPPGSASQQPAAEPPQDQDGFTVPPVRPLGVKHNDEIYFEGVTEVQAPRALRSAVARMHWNMGHPTRAELVRSLIAQGAKSTVLMLANALRCASCDRSRTPRRPNPSKQVRIGQFSDRLYSDLIHRPGADGTKHGFLGILDIVTLYHVVIRAKIGHQTQCGIRRIRFGSHHLAFLSFLCVTRMARLRVPSSTTLPSLARRCL